jgi:glycosyltransferase involved in cell wall biosynthesis
MIKKALVSIGMPVYNEGGFLIKSLQSLLDQDHQNFEIIISDNCSTDETQQICLEFAKKDRRIKYYRNDENVGAIENFRKVIDLASGQYFMLASGHDLWQDCYISACLQQLDEHPEAVLCYSLIQLIDVNDKPLKIIENRFDTRGLSPITSFNSLLWSLRGGNPIYGIIRTNVLKKVRMVDCMAMDMIFLAELSLRGAFIQIPEPLFHRRVNKESESSAQAIERRDKELFKRQVKQKSPNYHRLRIIYEHLGVMRRAPLGFVKKTALFMSGIPAVFYIYGGVILEKTGRSLRKRK